MSERSEGKIFSRVKMAIALGTLDKFTVESYSMEYIVPQETIDEFQKFDELMASRQKRHGCQWVPLFKEGQRSVKVHLVLEGPSATKMTVMEGTRIIDRGMGLHFVQQNARYFDCSEPEIDIKPGDWLIAPHHGLRLFAKSIVWQTREG